MKGNSHFILQLLRRTFPTAALVQLFVVALVLFAYRVKFTLVSCFGEERLPNG
uniref:Uncharacterized protein n=1 Tax=Anguilla anguilla TaxID=7936 RepID=A0A0E9PJC0_ANGAN